MNIDQEFFNKYWDEYKRLMIDERDDSQILSFRDAKTILEY